MGPRHAPRFPFPRDAALPLAFVAVGPPAARRPRHARRPSLNTERIAAIVASPDRSEADRQNDVRRKPVEMLTFIGVRPA